MAKWKKNVIRCWKLVLANMKTIEGTERQKQRPDRKKAWRKIIVKE